MSKSQPTAIYENVALNPAFRQSEGVLLHALLQSTDYGVLVSGLDRQDIVANRRLGELFGMPPRLIVETAPDAVRSWARSRTKDPQRFDRLLDLAYEDPTYCAEDEIELRNEPPVVLRRYTSPVHGPDGLPVARLWTFLDITETKRLQCAVQAQLDARTDEYQATTAILRVMNALCSLSLEQRSTDQLLAIIVETVRGLAGHDCAAILLQSPDGAELYGIGCPPGRNTKPIRMRYTQDHALKDAIRMDAGCEPGLKFHPYYRGSMARRLDCRSLAVSTLLNDNRVIGVLVLGFSAPDTSAAVTPLRTVHLNAIVNQIALTLRTHRLQLELRTAMESLQITQQRMVEMEKLRTAGALAASVAHDIRNILTVLQMEMDALPASVTASMADHLNRFSALTHRLLAFSRPSILETRPTSVIDVIRRIVPLIAGQAEISGVAIVVDAPESVPAVAADASQLEHLFVNLCLNGIQAISDKRGRLELTIRDKGSWISITVTDTGCGIAQDVIDRLFDPFFTTRATGAGLGLFSCKRIVEEHGGQLTVKSISGEGACFTVLLPIIQQLSPIAINTR